MTAGGFCHLKFLILKKFFSHLSIQVLIAIILAILFGIFFPNLAVKCEPVGQIFLNLIKMITPPIVFLTIVLGIGGMSDLKKIGRVGLKAFIYFEVVTTFALVIGLVIINFVNPGGGIDTSHLQQSDISQYVDKAKESTSIAAMIFPHSFFSAFAEGEILQVVFLALLFGLGLAQFGEKGKPLVASLDRISKVFFKIIGVIMRFAPIGAFGAMAAVIGKYGLTILLKLGSLMLCVYVTMFLFIVLVLGSILKYYKVNLWKLLKYIKEEIILVLGTSSSESALPLVMDKLERLGCSRSVVGLVVPTGYSFNLDGTSIYLVMATVFIAQATNTPLTLLQQITIIGVLMLTSKGAAGVSGSGFVVLVSTLTAMQVIPVAGAGLLLGVDKFMSEARAITNLIGNTVATVVVAKSENELNMTTMQKELNGGKSGKDFAY